jgi:hypothetical protein
MSSASMTSGPPNSWILYAFIAAFYRVSSFRTAVTRGGWSVLTLGGAVLIVLVLSVWLFGR